MNLFCQEAHCPAEMSPIILDNGDWCGDIEITRPISVLRSAVLYEGVQQDERVFLKIAHPGEENKERLKREAEFLSVLRLNRDQSRTLPKLLPPYPGAGIKDTPYGKIMLGSHLLYYYLFPPFEGEPLRDVLAKNPQLWINHVGWLTSELAATVNYLHLKGMCHLGLSPDCVLVRFDDKTNIPRVLLFDLGIASDLNGLPRTWYPDFVLPAYTAPELADGGRSGGRVDYRTDVFGVGLVLYEMLVGKPVYPFKLLSDEQVYEAVSRDRRTPMTRVEDVQRVAQIATQAVSHDPNQRQADAYEIVRELEALFGRVPSEKKSFRISPRTLFLAIGALLIVVFLLTLALTLNAEGTAFLGAPDEPFGALSAAPLVVVDLLAALRAGMSRRRRA
jgi:serine/threonine protein kinase